MIKKITEDVKFARYKCEREIGRGGMGTVFLARDTELDRHVAIKYVVKTESNSLLARRLQHEARLLAQLNHPNIVQLYDIIDGNDGLGLTLELVNGATILQKVKENLPSKQDKLLWLTQIARGLAEAHDVGIVHCDLKPDNILVTDDGVAKISDFGIAKARRQRQTGLDNLTQLGNVSGSYLWLSPEQATGEEVDFRSDLFSFGVLAHLLLTGRHPFADNNVHLKTVHRIISGDHSICTRPNTDMDEDLRTLVSQLLQHNPENRPSDTRHVIDALNFIAQRNESHTSNTQATDLTTILPIQEAHSTYKRSLPWAIGSCLCVLAAITYGFWQTPNPKPVENVLILPPSVNTTKGFDTGQKDRIATVVEQSLQAAIISQKRTRLVPATNVQKFTDDLATLARVNAADHVVKSKLSCSVKQCDIQLQRLSLAGDESISIDKQRGWPALSTSLLDIRSSTMSEVAHLFNLQPDQHDNNASSPATESFYEKYIQLFHSTSGGNIVDNNILAKFNALVSQSPSFISAYSLYTRGALNFYRSTKQISALEILERTLDSAPISIRNTREMKRLMILTLLEMNRIDEAEAMLVSYIKLGGDRVRINELKASFAYAKADYNQMLKLDNEIASLQPSNLRLSNLASSQLTVGDYNGAKKSLTSALALYPDDIYSLELTAVIALLEGNVNEAVTVYSKIVEHNPNSINLSNFASALIAKGRYAEAATYYQRAIKLDDENAVLWQNLGDSLELEGHAEEAALAYQKAIEFSTSLAGVEDYIARAKSYAHLGKTTDAIKVLKLAEPKFSTVAELRYAAATVHTLSNNLTAAVVEAESAIKGGMGAIWFSLPWFTSLCGHEEFRAAAIDDNGPICSAMLAEHVE